MQKHGFKNNLQHYRCINCNKTFSNKKQLNPVVK
ncbi:IS1/IS1595 family N-terminal zinc-binding domain-containing protein [Rodentibacter abscessus]